MRKKLKASSEVPDTIIVECDTVSTGKRRVQKGILLTYSDRAVEVKWNLFYKNG